ncbi:MAG: replication-associated recombination protein A [Proteobacteria bacterium]|nr:replication-associated recombination protein A [Pseudomonadota bacterium]
MPDPKPLADRMRPKRIEEMVGQDHLLGPGTVLFRALQSGRLFSVIFWGPPGSGKTSLAKLMSQYTQNPFRSFSAVTSGVKDLREVINGAEKAYKLSGRQTILFVDEIHRFNKAQQDAFLPYVESGLLVLVGATTQNPSFEIIPPLLSRARVMVLHPLEKEDLLKILNRAMTDKEAGLGELGLVVEPEALGHLIDLSAGDARVALNNLEIAAYFVVQGQKEGRRLDLKAVEEALSRKALPYDKDGEEHYNLISAFHKSLRGSDAQASLYWLYRMLMAGEDPLFICRRMIRFASEDIGLADPNALQVALAAFEAWQKVGPPEAELALAEAAVYQALAPKSNALYLAEKAVKAEIEATGPEPVPLHIRNAPTSLMKRLGYARGYLYPHNYPGARVEQEYLPEKMKNRLFYRPTDRGFEKEIRRRMPTRKEKED